MATRRPTPSPVQVRQRSSRMGSTGAFLKRWTIPIVGGITPVGLIVVNVAIYIGDHLQELRWGISIAAFLSGMMLNTWTGLAVYRWVQRRWPDWEVVKEEHQEVLLVGGMGVITIISFVSAYYCYVGLSDTKHLPNAQTFLYGAIQIAMAFVMKWYVDWDKRRARKRTESIPARTSSGTLRNLGVPGSLPSSPGHVDPAEASVRGRVASPPPTTGGGYVPPSYLPPS